MFHRLAHTASLAAGAVWLFVASLAAFLVWGILGPVLGWSELWHLLPTSLLTWLTWIILVLVQHAQITQERAMQSKLDALICALPQASNTLVGLEEQAPATVAATQQAVQRHAQQPAQQGRS